MSYMTVITIQCFKIISGCHWEEYQYLRSLSNLLFLGSRLIWFSFFFLGVNTLRILLILIVVQIFSCIYCSPAMVTIVLCSNPLPIFKLGYLSWVFLLLRFKISLYILDTGPLSGIWFANIFPHSRRWKMGCLVTLMVFCFQHNRF